MNRGLTSVFALACGAMVANLYYSQALIGLIAPAIGLAPRMAGLVVTLTQLGYGSGLLLIVSLADLVENRRLALVMLAGVVLSLVGIATSHSATVFLVFSFLTGFCCVGAQILIPFAAHLASDENRGRVVGNIMGGLVAGIMLARPAASFLAASFGWRAIFWVSAVGMVALGVLLFRMLPERRPRTTLHYGQILLSTVGLLVNQPVIRRRAVYQATMFGAFNLFWTATPLFLAQRFGFGQRGIALFALAGAGGAFAAPIAGRLADRGHIRSGTMGALLAAIFAFLVAGWSGVAGMLIVLAAAAILLDGATQFNQVTSQRVIYSIDPAARGRITSIFMTCVFLGGATGSSLAPVALIHNGWLGTSLIGAAMLGAAFLFFLTERRDQGRTHAFRSKTESAIGTSTRQSA
jgi:predicted MFS family arabinose efflux permease